MWLCSLKKITLSSKCCAVIDPASHLICLSAYFNPGLVWYTNHISSNFLKTVFHKFYLVHSWILLKLVIFGIWSPFFKKKWGYLKECGVYSKCENILIFSACSLKHKQKKYLKLPHSGLNNPCAELVRGGSFVMLELFCETKF